MPERRTYSAQADAESVGILRALLAEREGEVEDYRLQAESLGRLVEKWKRMYERRGEENARLLSAAEWLLKCHDDVERKVPVRNYDEAWEGLRHAAADALVVCSECRQPLDSLGCQAGGGHRDSVFKGTAEYEALRATATPLINFQTQPEDVR